MGIARTWRKLKVLKAAGQAANEAAARNAPGPAAAPQGFAAAFANVFADAMAPWMAVMAERRGGPLPGTDAAVMDGSAWTQPVAIGADALRARDAAFDPVLLAQFAGQVFAAVTAVWTENGAGSIRTVLADALWEPLAAATGAGMGASRRETIRRGPDGLHRPRATARVAGLHAGSWYDSARVIMSVNIDFAQRPAPPAMPEDMKAWREDWLFQRSVRPGGDPMIRPPACPSCGAPTRVDEAGLCTHCRAGVPFLTTGWLATAIVSRHPGYARTRQRLTQEIRANPEIAQRMTPGTMRLRPPGVTPDGSIDDALPGWAL